MLRRISMSTFNSFGIKIIGAFFIVPILALSVFGQNTGTISGTVTDSNGGLIAGASVTLISDQIGSSRSAVSNTEGRFTFTTVQPGTYTVKIENQGFQTLQRTNTVLSANENLTLGDIALTAGNVSETVTVTSSGQLVETTSSDLTARLTSDQIALISTKGRDFTSLLRLLPGTSNNDDIEAVGEGFGTDLPNISGQRGRTTTTSIDGLTASEPSGSNKVSMSVNQDAVGEVQVLRNNYSAEYGNNGGAIINVVTKGGGKDYRGTAYYFLRNEALNANNHIFNKTNVKRPLYRHNIWGGNFGGPMWLPRFGEGGDFFTKDKAFFFFSYEKPHSITPQDPRFVTVPTALERSGDFTQSINSSNAQVFVRDPLILSGNCNASDQTACFRDPSRGTAANPQGINIIPASRINPNGAALLKYFPLPNTSGSTSFNYVTQSPADVPKRSLLLRFDFTPTNKDRISWKMQKWTSDNEGTGTSGWPGGDNNRWGINSHYLYKDDGWSANWVHIFGSSMVNEFNFGMRHDSEGFVPSDGMVEGLQRSALGYTAPQLFPENNTLGTVPRATGWNGVRGVNPANINWLDRWGEVASDYIKPSFADNFSYTQGNHTLKFGVFFERIRNSEAPGGQWSGVFNFRGDESAYTAALGNTGYAYSNALVGSFRNYQESSARPFTNLEIRLFQWYAQDQWKISRKFTLNYGVRFGHHTPFFQVDEQGSNFVPDLFDPAHAVALYESACAVAFTPPATCPAAQRRARDPITGQLFPLTGTNSGLVGAIVPGSGNPTNGLMLNSDPSTPRGFRITRAVDIEPRLGFAWDILGSGKTVIRGMGGMYHAPRIGGGTTGGNLVNNPPATRTVSIDFGNIDQLANLSGTALFRPTALNAVELNSHTPVTYNFSIGFQQDIGFDTLVEVSYVGSRSRYLGELRNINGIPDGAKLGTNNIDPVTGSRLGDDFLRPYRGYGNINMITWGGNSRYDGLQVQVNRRYTRSFQYGIAYTYSKTQDRANDDSSDVFFPRPYNAFNYGPADFDQPHILTVNYIWDLPKLSKIWDNGFVRTVFDGWQISGTTSYASGRPKIFGNGPSGSGLTWTYNAGTATITAGQTCPPGTSQTSATVCTMITDFTGGTVNARPVVTCDPNVGATGSDTTGTAYVINRDCFTVPTAVGDIGNLGRNTIRLPSIFNTDLAVFKNFRIGENRAIQLRWETYNVFNTTNFRDINGVMTFAVAQVNPGGTGAACTTTNVCTAVVRQTNNAFGTPNSARSPRVMQASIRLNF
ncbi:MAG: hypothetical protein DMF62_09210 [Acidobacteria bacterium]|nr:MAG: hypothetical protein DMF62_09210 [Acidobacteriota bacterium]